MAFRLLPYRNFVEGYQKHPDQGLKASEKRLKKEPSNTQFLLAQAEFLWRLRRFDEALKSIWSLKFAPTDPLDPELLSEIQYLVAQCQKATLTFNHTLNPALSALWKQAQDNAHSQDLRIVRKALFRAAWRDEYWDLAQQLFARLQKENPNQVQYHFAWIACSQMQATMMPKDDKMAQNLKLLAFRSLKAIVDNTIAKKDTQRKLSDSHHLRLIDTIYSAQNEYSDLLGVYINTTLDAIPTIGANNIEFIRAKVEVLQKLDRQKELFDFAYGSLKALLQAKASGSPKRKAEDMEKGQDNRITALSWADDWHIWQAMIDSQKKEPTSPEAAEEISSLIQDFLSANSTDRNATRAYLMWITAHNRQNLLAVLIETFTTQCSRRACFGDLRQFLKDLSHPEEEKFLNHIDEEAKSHTPWSESGQSDVDLSKAKDWVMINVNALKFEYLLCISKAPLPTKDSLEAFVSDALRMYKISLGIDRECGDEACLLVVMALVKLHHFSRDHELDENDPTNRSPGGTPAKKVSPQCYLVQAISLLQLLHSNSPHNYSASLLSIAISQMLNLTSMACAAISPLNVKEVQHDTTGHLFWSRISISHPFDCSKSLSHRSQKGADYSTPAVGLANAAQWFENASDRTMTFMSDILDIVPFDKFAEFNAFRHNIENSFSRALYILELHRLNRLTGASTANTVLPPDFDKMIQDNRDFATIPSYEYPSTQTFDSFVLSTPKPSRYWLARQTTNTLLIHLLTTKPPHEPYLLPLLDTSVSYLESNISDISYQLTPAELAIAPAWDALLPLVAWLILGPSDTRASKNIAKDITAFAGLLSALEKAPEHDVLPSSEAVHAFYLRYDILLAARTFVDAATLATKGKSPIAKSVPIAALKSVTSAVDAASRVLREAGSSWRDSVKREGKKVVQELVGAGATGEEIGELFSEVGGWSVDGVVKDIVESAVDALDGLSKVKV
ncbi:hypothetical protein BT63DRAFT_48014 [Microthyrium microscopicum]|uniref:Cytoskeleton organization protein n=1 Tax=Microthyrium microscopicum TaxID=703497 RepID=A0A6A6U4J2_9PEZI|nr:hypothetical protein BT63DRAFT_48014 [Microthyrium microscopicum]